MTVTVEESLHRQLLQQANTVQLESFTTVLGILDPVTFFLVDNLHVTATFNLVIVVHFRRGEMQVVLGNTKI